ncbi:arginine--tRNA ligase [Candidatus Peregrinibacteria bacterium]|nr:arginine--tRNA ligase [Candidatus Peregrinibacteria bacterium]
MEKHDSEKIGEGEKMEGQVATRHDQKVVTHGVGEVHEEATEVIGNALLARNRQLGAQVLETLAQRKSETVERHLPPLSQYALPQLEAQLQALLVTKGYEGAQLSLTVPPSSAPGAAETDLCCNVAQTARRLKRNPIEFAAEVAELFRENARIASVTTAGPFVNIQLNHSEFAPAVLGQIQENGEGYGSYNEGNGDVVLVDYSAPNVAKNMTVAHLRSTIIGHSLSNLHAAAGYTPLRINHLGDWGTQFGKIIYQYRKEIAQEGDVFLQRLEANPTTVLLEIYRKFVAAEKEDHQAVEDARGIFLQLEQGDPELTALWQKFLAWSIKDFEEVYKRLDIEFDAVQGESFYEDRMAAAVEEGLQKGALRRNEEGAVVFPGQPLYDPSSKKINEKIMKGKDEQYRDEVILKPTGGTVYLTRDLAAIRYRTQELGAKKILYVIGKEQQKHCLMLFAMAEQLGYIKRGQAEHISFGHLNVDGRKMKSRGGKMALLTDVLNESIEAAGAVIAKKNTGEGSESEAVPLATDAQQETARQVGISAVIFNDLRQDRTRDIEFVPDAAQHVESGQSPYLQYTYCRLKAIMEKVGDVGNVDRTPEQLSAMEREILVELSMFPSVIQEAVTNNAPHRIATYMTDLCQLINNFYTTHPVAKAEGDSQSFRLALVTACQRVLQNAAHLLHIDLPDRM